MPVTHGTVVVVADDGTSPVGTDEWNAALVNKYQPTEDVTLAAGTEDIVDTDAYIIDSGRLVIIPSTSLLWADSAVRQEQQIPATYYRPTVDQVMSMGATTVFHDDPVILDPNVVMSLSSTSLVWTDAARPEFRGGGQSFLYLPVGWDAVWKSAKANSYTAPAFCAGLGMSIQSGRSTTAPLTKNYFRLARDTVIDTQGYPNFGEFYDVKQSGPTNGYDPGWTTTSPWVFTNAPTWPGYGWNIVAAGPALTTFAWSYTTVRTGAIELDIIYWDGITSGSWGYNVDGGATQTVTVTATAAGTAVQKRVVVNASTPGWSGSGTHVINFTTQDTAASKIYLQGVAEIYRSNGVGFAHTAYIGASVLVSARLDSAVNPTDKMVAWQGNTAIYPGPFNVGFGFPTQPDLAIIELGGNDTADPGVTGNAMGAGPEQYYNGLRRLIDAIRRGNPNASIMFVAISIPGPDSNSCDFTGTSVDNPVNWPLYLRVMDQLAHEYNCAFVNVHAKWGETILSQGYCTALDFHATDAGHADIASVIAQVI